MQTKSDPAVSILMTSYNRAAFISEAIEGVLASTFPDFELIIVDDASIDDTYKIATYYAQKDNRIFLYRNDTNIGQFQNRNKAASYAKGFYLMHADSDDILYPNAVEYCIEAMQKFPEAGFGMFCNTVEEQTIMLQPGESIRNHFFKRPFLTHGPGATIIKRSLFHLMGGFPEIYSVAGDMFYNLNAASRTPMVLLPRRFVNYRIHEGQELNNSFDYLWANYLYLKDAIKTLPFDLTNQEKQWLMNKNRRRAIVNFKNHFLKFRDLTSLKYLIRKTDFSFFDVLKALFH